MTDLKRLPGNTFQLTAIISWTKIKESYEEILKKIALDSEIPGFRKGKAPLEKVREQVNSSKVYQQAIQKILPDLYQKAVEEHKLKPIISPKIEILESEENKDWRLTFTGAEKPTIKLGDYKKAIANLITSKKKIWVPGETEDKKNGPSTTEILDVLVNSVEVEISPIFVDQEVNRQLSNLISQTQKLGLTVDQYLQAQGKTAEQLRKEYESEARKTLTLEFTLEEIGDVENVIVESSEIEEFIKGAKTPEEKSNLESQRYYISSILRRQKTIQTLSKPSHVESKINL